MMRVEYIHFPSREIRIEFIATRFRTLLEGKRVLDVGCDEAFLNQKISSMQYTGIDIGGNPDIRLDLEKIDRLPFDDQIFDTVLCSDVLEHIDNLHLIFGELIRVSCRHVVISLPNNWNCARLPLQRGRGSFAHYGLPVDPVKDRHKWFFGFGDAQRFVEGQLNKYPIAIKETFATEKRRPLPLRLLRRVVHGSQESYLNRYSNTLWVVFERRSHEFICH